MKWRYAILGGTAAAAAATTVHDLVQTKHAIVRNFPVIGHARFFLERFGPELRQYIVTSNDEERPFSRDQRRWVYASSKLENNYFGFGTDNDVERLTGYPIIKHRTFTGPGAATTPHAQEEIVLPCAKVMGAARGRTHAFRPASVVNISGMSFGSLSGKAIEALNKGAAMAGCCRTPARAPCRPTTATAATSSSRSAPPTSAAATSTAASTWHGWSTWCSRHRCARSRSSSARAPSPGSAACSPATR